MDSIIPPGVKEIMSTGAIGGVLVFLMWCMYRTGVWLGTEFKPVIASHKSLVDQLASSDEKQTDSLVKIASVVEKLGEHHEILPRIDRRVGEIHERMTQGANKT